MERETAADRVAREDLCLFIAAAFACTKQEEFYSGSSEQGMSLDFLHAYIMGNYRSWYARTLALGINDLNRSLVIRNLLVAGAPESDEERVAEGQLIRMGMRSLPPQRAWRLLSALRAERVNNRRTRATIRAYLQGRRELPFDAVKYRSHVRNAVRHARTWAADDLGSFLFERGARQFTTPLFESWRRAHFSQRAVYELPFSVAEGFAAKHGIKRETFLAGIEPRMTRGERLRVQEQSDRRVEIDLGGVAPTRLASYVLSLSLDERRERREELTEALATAATRVARRTSLRLPRVAAVLDASRSMSGSRQKRRRPLAVTVAVDALLRAASAEYHGIWIPGGEGGVCVSPTGQTNLVDGVLQALEHAPDLLVVVSDGYENDMAGATQAVVDAWRTHLDPQGVTSFVHVNPVFDARHFSPRALGPSIPVVGLRDADDLATVLPFVQFATGAADADALDRWIELRTATFLEES